MKAYIVHDSSKAQDLMVIPDTDRSIPVNREVMEAFIAVKPDFTAFDGPALNGLPVETFGQVVATRTADGDVCIVDEALWQQRMAAHLGGP